MRRRNMRPGSIAKRSAEIRGWLAYAGELWTIADVELVEDWLDGRNIGATTRYCAISHLHQFYIWAHREGLVESIPTTSIERPRLPRRLPRPARRADVEQVMETAPLELRVMLSLMVDAGLRCCEVASLQWCDVDLDAGTMHVTGKGGHQRVVGIPSRLAVTLAACDDVVGPVVGRKMSATRVSQVVNECLHVNGYATTAHQLRHLYATRMLEQTHGNLLAVQQALGHASVTSTQIYALVDPRSAIDAAHSLV